MSTYKGMGIQHAAILYSGAGVVSEQDIPYGNTFTMAAEFDTITFEGDGTSANEYSNIRLTGTIGGDKISEEVMEKLTGKTASTGVSGEAKTYYMGAAADLTPPQVGLLVEMSAINDSTEAAAVIRMTVFNAKISPFTPPDVTNNAKWAPIVFNWSAERTSTDIAGVALPDVPTGGALWSWAVKA